MSPTQVNRDRNEALPSSTSKVNEAAPLMSSPVDGTTHRDPGSKVARALQIALAPLGEDERRVILARFWGPGKPLSQEEAARLLNLSYQSLAEIEDRAMSKLGVELQRYRSKTEELETYKSADED